MNFHELIYCESSLQDVIKKEFPESVFKDASDIVTDRFSVDINIPNENIEDEFYVFAIKQGFARHCLLFELMIHTHLSKIKRWVELATVK